MGNDGNDKPTREMHAASINDAPPTDDLNYRTQRLGAAGLVGDEEEGRGLIDPNDSTKPSRFTQFKRNDQNSGNLAPQKDEKLPYRVKTPEGQNSDNKNIQTGEMPSFGVLMETQGKIRGRIIHTICTPPDIVSLLLERDGAYTLEQLDEAIRVSSANAGGENSADEILFYPPDIACISSITPDFYETEDFDILGENDYQGYIKKLRVEARIRLIMELEDQLEKLSFLKSINAQISNEMSQKISKIEELITFLDENYECRQFNLKNICETIVGLNLDRSEREQKIKELLAGMRYRKRAEFMTRLSVKRNEIEGRITDLDGQKKNDIIGHINYIYRREYSGRSFKRNDVDYVLGLIEKGAGGTISYEIISNELRKWDIKSRLDLYVSLKSEYGISSSRIIHEERDQERYDKIRLFVDFFDSEFREYNAFIAILNETRKKIAEVFIEKGNNVWLVEQGLEELIADGATGRVVTSWRKRVDEPDKAIKYSNSPSNDIPPMSHPNIIPEEIAATSNGGSICIAPYLEKMTLLDDLMKVNTIEQNLEFLLQAIEGNLYMHEECGLVHCDIKPANMVIIRREDVNNEKDICALFDLEGAYYLEQGKNHPSIDIRTTPYYSDVHFLGIPIGCYSVGKHTDIFSQGICLAEVFVGKENIKKMFREAKKSGLIGAMRERLLEMTKAEKMTQKGEMTEGNYIDLNHLITTKKVNAGGNLDNAKKESMDDSTVYVDADLFVDFVSKSFPLNMNNVNYSDKVKSIIKDFIYECGAYDAVGAKIAGTDFSFALETDVRLRQLSSLIGKMNIDVIMFVNHFITNPSDFPENEVRIRNKYNVIAAKFSESWQKLIEENLFKDFCIPEKMKQLIKGMLAAVPSERIGLRDALAQLEEVMLEM
ncbi:hypothetical protein KKG71_03915 [Patescibacteria group bacterium]|nr:hypothetical protein [Patescibacteria group bacterium]